DPLQRRGGEVERLPNRFHRPKNGSTIDADRLRGKPDVLEHRELAENIRALKGPSDSEARAPPLRLLRDVDCVEMDRPASWNKLAREQIDESRFARTIRPNDGVQLAPLQVERNAVDGDESTERARQITGHQQRGGLNGPLNHRPPPPCRLRVRHPRPQAR